MHYASLHEAVLTGTGIERSFLCHMHQDSSASASVNVLKGLWTCYACGARGSTKNLQPLTPELVKKRLELRERQAKRRDAHQHYPEAWLKMFTAAGPGQYWRSRFSDAVCEHYDLGVSPGTGAAVYPLRDPSGDLLGVVERNLSEDGPKYHYPWGIDVRRGLFGYHECTDSDILLTEGATDVMAAWEVGHQAMAIYGSSIRSSQLDLLRKYSPRRIGLAFDMDAAGQRTAQSVRELMSVAMPTVRTYRVSWRGAKDLAELDPEDRTRVLDKWQA